MLWYIFYAHIVLSFLLMFSYKVIEGIFELIAPAILYCGITQTSYCQLLIYIIINGMSFIFKGLNLYTIFSNIGVSESFSLFPLTMLTLVLLEVFYIASGIFTYFAYKEFNACAVPFNDGDDNEAEMGGNYGGNIGGYRPPNNFQPQLNNVRNNRPGGNQQYRAFEGNAVRLGGN